MKKLEWKNGKAVVDTGHAQFDKAFDVITVGNVMSNVQISTYVRPPGETKCNGFTFQPGHLRESDLKRFGRLPGAVTKELRGIERKVILYCLMHRRYRRGPTIHGFILTETEERNYELIRTWYTGPTYKSADVVRWCVPYLSNDPR